MLTAYGWVVVRTTRAPYRDAPQERLDDIDDEVKRADDDLFDRTGQFLSKFSALSVVTKFEGRPIMFSAVHTATANVALPSGEAYTRPGEKGAPRMREATVQRHHLR
jgi:hypothetical protein